MKKYEKYKDSGIEWIGEIPEHWEVKKLKYLANVDPSNVDKKSKEGEDEVLLCNYVDVYKNDFINSDINFMKATASKSQIEKFILKKYDVIATKDSETPDDIGNPALVIEDLENVVCGYHLTHIKPIDINGNFLFRFFQTQFIKSYFEVSANGVTRYGLGIDKLNSTLIAFPPPEEQTAIAAYLDRKTAQIDELIAGKKRLLELYEEEKTAIINNVVTGKIVWNGNDWTEPAEVKDSGIEWLGEIPEHWEVKRLKNICKVRQGLQIPIEKRFLKKEEDTLEYITIRSINNPEDSKQYISNPPPNVICTKDDILMARTGATGEPIINVEGVFHNNFFLVDFNRDLVEKMFLFYYLKSSKIKEYLLLVAGTTTIPDLNHGAFYSAPFFKFDKKEQTAIVNYIETETARINTKAEKTKKLIELLEEYKQALISEVVTGKVKVV